MIKLLILVLMCVVLWHLFKKDEVTIYNVRCFDGNGQEITFEQMWQEKDEIERKIDEHNARNERRRQMGLEPIMPGDF